MNERIRVIVRGDSMWPTLKDGEQKVFTLFSFQKIEVGDLVIVEHPFLPGKDILKRVTEIMDDSRIFLEGDNPDPTGTTDSHYFGPVSTHSIRAFLRKDMIEGEDEAS